ncbi:MAG: cell wall hydrolase [Clostridia bacterium]|nr:cell wall hydrolase [Clostridia bacterium]
MKRSKERRKRMALVLVCMVLLANAGALAASAAEYYIQPSVSSRVCAQYEEIPITVFGRTADFDAYLINGTTYVPLRSFCERMGACKVSYDAKARSATVSADGLSLTAADGSRLIMANGRALYHDAPTVILDDNRMYVPIRPIAKAYSLSVDWSSQTRSVTLSGWPKPILNGDFYYDQDELYWLGKIISAEARGESFLGQVAVGNVVLNRVASETYPDTVYSVIFDRRYGVQFAPVSNGSIYLAPTQSALLAARVCLEGYTVSDDALFFIEPSKAASLWVSENRPYLFTIGAHYFFE